MRNASNNEKNTFGASFKNYDKVMVTDGPQHYLGRGPCCDLPQDQDLSKTKKKVATIAKSTRDRGLVIKAPLWKEQKTSMLPSPGSYNTARYNSLEDYGQRRVKALPNLSKASRDCSFAKYASLNMNIYTRGLH